MTCERNALVFDLGQLGGLLNISEKKQILQTGPKTCRLIFYWSAFSRLGTKWSFDNFLTSSIFVPPWYVLHYTMENAQGYTLM